MLHFTKCVLSFLNLSADKKKHCSRRKVEEDRTEGEEWECRRVIEEKKVTEENTQERWKRTDHVEVESNRIE